MDPVFKEYESPYATLGNNPIMLIDPFGLDTTVNGKVLHSLPNATVTSRFKPKTYSVGSVSNNSPDDDLSKRPHGVDINTSLYDKNRPYDPSSASAHWSRWTSAYHLGTDLENVDAQYEALKLESHFETGQGKTLPPFGVNSQMSKILSKDANFVLVTFGFEMRLKEHYKKTGSLKGFDGTTILAAARGDKYMKGTLFMHTVLGGFHQVDAQIRIITADQISIRYTIWDHFGAGTDDAGSALPGLPSLYWLQHNSAINNPLLENWYTPFIWGINVDRSFNPQKR